MFKLDPNGKLVLTQSALVAIAAGVFSAAVWMTTVTNKISRIEEKMSSIESALRANGLTVQKTEPAQHVVSGRVTPPFGM